jgi:ferritin-like metal-binding protein YciE
MGLFSGMTLNTLDDLFVAQIEDLYDAETRLTDALPKMAETARNSQLKSAIQNHLRETEEHVRRLEKVFHALGIESKRHTCQAMKGLIAEGSEVLDSTGDPDVIDAAIIAAAQRVEHYEISGYGTARTLALRLGRSDIADVLNATLQEEGAADKKLTQIAESSVNAHAAAH